MDYPIALFYEGRAIVSENVLENAGGMEANIELVERSWQTKEECVQDVVAKCTCVATLPAPLSLDPLILTSKHYKHQPYTCHAHLGLALNILP